MKISKSAIKNDSNAQLRRFWLIILNWNKTRKWYTLETKNSLGPPKIQKTGGPSEFFVWSVYHFLVTLYTLRILMVLTAQISNVKNQIIVITKKCSLQFSHKRKEFMLNFFESSRRFLLIFSDSKAPLFDLSRGSFHVKNSQIKTCKHCWIWLPAIGRSSLVCCAKSGSILSWKALYRDRKAA